MAYSKQNFQNGQILNAANLEAMENGIIAGQGVHNLLDNSDFRDPVNHQGASEYSGYLSYTIDRWFLPGSNVSVTVQSGSIKATATSGNTLASISQKIASVTRYAGKTLTLAAYVQSNVTPRIIVYKGGTSIASKEGTSGSYQLLICNFTVPADITDGALSIRIQSKSTQAGDYVEAQWAALYEGSYDASTLPAYVPKGKHVEMLNCNVPLVPHNLLDNSDFRNPVNQRGVTSEVYNQKFIIDKWECINVSSDAPISVNTNGITLNNAAGTHTQGIEQYISIKDGTYTVAAKTDSSIWIRTFTYSNKTITNISSSFDGKGDIDVYLYYDNIYIAIEAFAGYSIQVDWAALYEGSYTADTLPSYVPKGKHVEMLNCGVPLTPHNLLDNSNFSNPIAQAGLNGMHGSKKYVCDRWISHDANATFGGNYIRPGSPIDQHLSKTVIDINKTYTAAFCYADGKIKAESGTFSNGFGSDALGIYCMKQQDSTDYVTVRLNTGEEIHWAALYEGSYNVSTLPAYQPKGYAAELAECQRYYYQSWDGASIPIQGLITKEAISTSSLALTDFPNEMRIVPTITLYTTANETGAVKEWITNSSVSATQNYTSTKAFGVNSRDNFTIGKTYFFHYAASADL